MGYFSVSRIRRSDMIAKGLLMALATAGATSFGVAAVPSFPGALGFGNAATGGRTGKVVHVTNLNDAGAGSFRDAVSASNRIVVFDVGGWITLQSAISLSGNLTIEGQTAPGGGIGIKSGKISCGAHSNIILRYLRIVLGSETASTSDVGLNLLNARDIIVDHCSIEFAPYDNIDGVSTDWQATPVTDITFQNSLIADPIGQQFGAHCESVSSSWAWYYDAFVNSHNRNPLAKTNTVYVNNVNYDNEADYTTHTSTTFSQDIVNNYFIEGPGSGSANTWFQIDANQSIYANGNLKDANKDGALNGSATTVSWYSGTGTSLSAPWSDVTKNNPVLTPATAFRLVTSRCGALPYNTLDSLIWSQVRSIGKAGKIYTSQTETGLSNNGYGTIAGGTKNVDTDNDGMPDFWEKAMGSDPAADDAMELGSDGYASVEQYANWLGTLHARVPNNAAVDVDLAAFTQGFQSVSPTYAVAGASKGSVTVSGHVARFVPTAGATGLGSFDFTVKGNDGTSWTGTVSTLCEPGSTTLTRGGRIREPSGMAPATVTWLDPMGRMLLRQVQTLDPQGPRPIVPKTLAGLVVARVEFDGQAPGSIRLIGTSR
jgi:hypothetical protein